eukprot:951121-Amphidinium_carterae.1
MDPAEAGYNFFVPLLTLYKMPPEMLPMPTQRQSLFPYTASSGCASQSAEKVLSTHSPFTNKHLD